MEEQSLNNHHHREEQQPKPYLKVRNILNAIFMLGAIVGMIVYFFSNKEIGTYIIFGAMAVKLAECCLRIGVK